MKILFFAALRDALGTAELDWPASPGQTLADLRRQLMAQSPQWQQAFASYARMSAVDQELAHDGTPLDGAREVAFFPLVTGG
ncbi:MoaD/ThiS family protein [Azomonas macrocytogenes]|uniref:Molybdopterin synthase sulfur carrier subunit n=1 Tax=Azomonas macrocytogenes TaxID=69962 RepID=A0A839T1Y7_AZOMA|nr:MoaD/ThiS family protein [Azomonas macrocytogenes]MBB3101965.1 molybdopterin synthase sulfur carrier subunit [Azomonas macrocytogenes]